MFLSSVLFVLMYDLFSRTVFTFDILLLFKKKINSPPLRISGQDPFYSPTL